MHLTKKIEHLLFETPTWKLLAVVFTLCLVKTGIWWYPNPLALWAMAQDPFASPFTQPDEHYLMWNWLGPWLAWLVGATSMTKLFLFFLACAVGFVALFARVALVQLPREQARTAIVLFALLPVSTTAFFWVGQDGLTLLLLMAALAFPAVPLATLALGVLLGLQHFEQAFFAAAGLGAAVCLGRRQGVAPAYGLRFCLLLALGAVAGKLGLVYLFKHYEIHVNSGRMYWLRNHAGMMLSAFFLHLHGIAWSLLGVGWLAAARFADAGRKSLPFFLALGGLFLLAAVTADQTRVLATVTFPLIVAYWLLNPGFLSTIARRETALLFGLWIVVPVSWVWSGLPRWSLFPYDVAWVLHQAFGWFALPENLFAWPFG
nr:hypothetical protein [uncultured Massilia sp.]